MDPTIPTQPPNAIDPKIELLKQVQNVLPKYIPPEAREKVTITLPWGGGTIEKSVEQPPPTINPIEHPQEFAHFFQEFYSANNLPEWSVPANEVTAKIAALSAEKRAQISQEMQNGAIAIVMPGRKVQQATFKKMLENLRPRSRGPRGVDRDVGPARLYDDAPRNTELFLKNFERMLEAADNAFFDGVPENPYIMLTKAKTMTVPRGNVEEQKQHFLELQKTDPNMHAMNVPGFVAFSAVYSTFVEAQTREYPDHIIEPIDSSNTNYVRFISFPISKETAGAALIPMAWFALRSNGSYSFTNGKKVREDSAILFGGSYTINRDGGIGYRTEIRIEL